MSESLKYKQYLCDPVKNGDAGCERKKKQQQPTMSSRQKLIEIEKKLMLSIDITEMPAKKIFATCPVVRRCPIFPISSLPKRKSSVPPRFSLLGDRTQVSLGHSKLLLFVWFRNVLVKLYRRRVPRLTSDNLTCYHTRDRKGRPWLLSQPVTL